MSTEKYRKLLREVEDDPEYWVRLSALEFVQGLQRLLDQEGLTRAKLAKRAGVKPSVVSRALRGDANLTLRMMNKLARVVDAAVHVHVERRSVNGVWVPFTELARGKAAPPQGIDIGKWEQGSHGTKDIVVEIGGEGLPEFSEVSTGA